MEGALKPDATSPTAASVPAAEPARETQIFTAPEIMCGGCLRNIETALADTPGVEAARANLSARRVTVTFDPEVTSPNSLSPPSSTPASPPPRS